MNKKLSALTLVELLVVIAIIALVVALLLPMKRGAREAARRNSCQNSLKQIALALLRYEKEHGSLPPAYTVDAEGNRLHSWRTLILPYLEQQVLYDTIDLSKPWDDSANERARHTIVEVYECPSLPVEQGLTTYFVVVGADSAFLGSETRKSTDILDGPESTILVLDASHERAIPWMSPQDCSPKEVLHMFGHEKNQHPGTFAAAFADGHPQQLDASIDPTMLQGLMTIAGKEQLGDDW